MASPPEASPSELASKPHPTRMLLIDDDRDFAELAVKFLREGCIESIDAVNSGKDALARLDTNEYDVIMCDYRMHEMDGIELLKEVRSRGIHAPFVMMTGTGMDDAAIEALDAGADLHVEKSGDMRAQFAQLSVVLRNLVRRKQAEMRLKGERDLYKAIVDMNIIGILVLDADGKVVIWNDGIAKLTGIGIEDAIGRPFSQESTPLLSEIVERGRVEDVLNGRISQHNLMPCSDRESGKTRYFEVGYYPVPDEKGRTSASMIFVLDSTERKKAEEALRQANEKLSLMGSITRHDAINQIGILSGYLSLAEDDSNDRERAEHMEAAKKACRTITEQLQFAGSYQKAGTKDPEWTRVRLEFAGAVSVIDMEGMQVKEKLGDLEVLADPMFERVLLNLLTNTRRHGQNATQVVVEFEPKDDAVAITYSDDGVGISADAKEKIFQRGYGTDSGLGLFLVREVLGITGMSIREIGVPDEGAVFEILVPSGKHRMPSESG